MIKRKAWTSYTEEEKQMMKNTVSDSDPSTPFSPDYAAAYLGKSFHTLQYMRCHHSNTIIYSKIGRHVVYRKKHLDEYLDNSLHSSTSNY